MGTPVGYVLHTPCPEIYCLSLIDEYCENYAEIPWDKEYEVPASNCLRD